jgi:hypothetical protein
MIHFLRFITHTKVAKVVLSGELANFQPFGNHAEGLFLWKKEDF